MLSSSYAHIGNDEVGPSFSPHQLRRLVGSKGLSNTMQKWTAHRIGKSMDGDTTHPPEKDCSNEGSTM